MQTLLPLLKEHASPSEYDAYRTAIATALASIAAQITNRALAEDDTLSDEIEAWLKTCGRLL